MSTKGEKGDVLPGNQGLKIEGFSDEKWHSIIRVADLTLKRGQVMGLIGESGAGKSTLGLASIYSTRVSLYRVRFSLMGWTLPA